jgi:hypothetical protein
MKTKNVIKKTLNEVAGISFEVRKWAQIIERYVTDYIASEREKLKSQKPIETPKVGYSLGDDDLNFGFDKKSQKTTEEDITTEYTHFESHGGDVYDSAFVYGSELFINSDILTDFPDIKRIVRDKLFEIELDGEGGFTVDVVGSSFPDDYLDGILEMVEDHMVMGEPFHTDNYDEVFAVVGNEEITYDYMSEDNRWSYGGSYSGYGKGGYYQPQPKIDKIEINGRDFPEAYENFKVDKWIITSSNRIEYDHWKSGYNENGEYIVYLNMPMYSVGGSALIHEVKHAYDDWNRMSRGGKPIRAGWEIKNIYTPDFEKLVLGGSKINYDLSGIIRYYYLGSKLETPAYLENEYDSYGSSGQYRDTAKKMMNFKASSFLDKDGNPKKGLQEGWTQLITQYDIPFFRKFKNVVDFLNYTEKHFNKRGRDILRRIDKMRYVHNKPMAKPQPTTYAKPTQTTKTSKPQTEWDKLNDEIDVLEAEWDKKYEIYLKNRDPKLRKELDDQEKIINQKIDKLNSMFSGGDLPF